MRTVPFKEVLWSVARKAGYSPESGNFLTNQAVPIGEYINEWTSRLYMQEDWPEWTKVLEVTPDLNHIVAYTVLTSDREFSGRDIARVIDVFLRDPVTTRCPISTRFSLREEGIHVGYEHGTNVWIKYIEPSPHFTAEVWEASVTYTYGQSVYAPSTGECYVSRISNNLNHDPTGEEDATPMQMSVIQDRTDPVPASPEQDQIVDLSIIPTGRGIVVPDPHPAGGIWSVTVMDSTGAILANFLYVNVAPESLASITTDIRNGLAPLLPLFTITADTTNKKIRFQNGSHFLLLDTDGSDGPYYMHDSGSIRYALPFHTVQPYVPANPGSPGLPQIQEFWLSASQVLVNATYEMVTIDSSGIEYPVSYVSNLGDSALQILQGLAAAIGAAAVSANPGPWAGVTTAVNAVTVRLDVTSPNTLSIEARVTPGGSRFWQILRFPEVLLNPVVRGASATLLGEWGQADKQTTEEGKVPQETQMVRGDLETTPNAQLTTQQKPYSRYRY